jgi:protein-tyrosine phosphatase
MPCLGTKSLGLQTSKGVKTIVTLITDDEEMKARNVTTLGTNAGELSIRWYHLAIEDDRIPNEIFSTGWAEASPELHQVLKAKKTAERWPFTVCMAGSGRTGMVTRHLVLEKGGSCHILSSK